MRIKLPVILVILLSLLGCAKTPSDNVTATAPSGTSSDNKASSDEEGGLPAEEGAPPVAPGEEDETPPVPDESSSDHAMTLSESGSFLEKLETVDRCHDIPTGYLYAAQFDELGNLKCRAYDGKFYSYTYDILGRLTHVMDEGPHASPLDMASLSQTGHIRQTVMEMMYDHQGQLRRKTSSNITTYYIGGSYEIREEGGSQSKTLSITAPGLGLISTVTTGKLPSQPGPEDIQRLKDKPMEGTSAAGPVADTLYYWPNHLGTPSTLVTHLVNGQPEVVSRDLKLPYGMDNRANSQGVVSTPNQYTGHTYLEENKLYYANARYYDPVIGRFASVDPMTPGNGMLVDGLNPYPYGLNDPQNNVDPTGSVPDAPLIHDPVTDYAYDLYKDCAKCSAASVLVLGASAFILTGTAPALLAGIGDASLLTMGIDATALNQGITAAVGAGATAIPLIQAASATKQAVVAIENTAIKIVSTGPVTIIGRKALTGAEAQASRNLAGYSVTELEHLESYAVQAGNNVLQSMARAQRLALKGKEMESSILKGTFNRSSKSRIAELKQMSRQENEGVRHMGSPGDPVPWDSVEEIMTKADRSNWVTIVAKSPK